MLQADFLPQLLSSLNSILEETEEASAFAVVQPESATGVLVRHCAMCGINEEQKRLMRCARCQMKWYCSKTCQREHWKLGHKLYCVQVQRPLLPQNS